MCQCEQDRAHRTALLGSEAGAALVMAIMASLLLLVFAISFSSLANLEARVGVNDYRSRQAQLIAEAGFEAVRNHLRLVAQNYTDRLGNTYTCDPGASPACSCTTGANGTAAGVLCSLDGLFPVTNGRFTIRVDNDPEDPGFAANQDLNGQVMLTALGRTTGATGRAQARVQVLLDDPFKHVCASDDVQPDCANYQGDNPCTPGGIFVDPCQPEDPHGPKVFPGLPTPDTIVIVPGDGRHDCINTPGVGWATRWAAENAGNPNPRVIGNANPAQSYFDMALGIDALAIYNAVLPPNRWIPDPPAGRNRRGYCQAGSLGCNIGDPAIGNANPHPNTLGCGLVIDGDWSTPNPGVKYINTLASLAAENVAGTGVVVYVTAMVTWGNKTHVQGTVVVHGDAVAGNWDVNLSPDDCINRLSDGNNCGDPNPLFNSTANAPGYPMAMIIWHPGAGAGSPPPQNTIAKISNTGVKVSGLLYSGGTIEFNPISVEGGIVAWGVDVQGNSQIVYNNTYGGAAKTGFTIPLGSYSAQFMRSTFLHCRQTDPNNDFTAPDQPPPCS